jgi:hypothetical protein
MSEGTTLVGELDQCHKLVEDALLLLRATTVLEGPNRENMECLLERVAEELRATQVFLHALRTKSPLR